jgi:hypothetical protein
MLDAALKRRSSTVPFAAVEPEQPVAVVEPE